VAFVNLARPDGIQQDVERTIETLGRGLAMGMMTVALVTSPRTDA